MPQDIKKAIKIADYLIMAHIKSANGMEELVKDWNSVSKGLGTEIVAVHRDVAKCIEEIKNCLMEKPKTRRKVGHTKSK